MKSGKHLWNQSLLLNCSTNCGRGEGGGGGGACAGVGGLKRSNGE